MWLHGRFVWWQEKWGLTAVLKFLQMMEGLAEVVVGEKLQVFVEEKILAVLKNLRLNQKLITMEN